MPFQPTYPSRTPEEAEAERQATREALTDYYVVVCRSDRDTGTLAGPYELATRTVFETSESAEKYAAEISASRAPLVVAGRFAGLRWDAAERFGEK